MKHSTITRRPLHHHAFAIIFPLGAHWHHGRYAGKPLHLVLDSGLSLIMFCVALWLGVGVWFLRLPTDIGISAVTTSSYMNEATKIETTIHNDGSKSLEDVRVTVRLPREWRNVTPTATMMLGTIPPKADSAVPLTILPVGKSDRSYTMSIVIQGQRDGLTITRFVRLHLTPKPMRVTFAPPISTSVIGQPQTLHMAYESDATSTLSTLAIRVRSTATVAVQNDHPMVQHEIAPKQRGEFTIQYTSKRTGDLVLPVELGVMTDRGFVLERIHKLKLHSTNSKTPEELIGSTPQLGANMSAEALYFSAVGFQFGYGQFPPRVAQETTFRIFWHIRPSSSAASSALVTAKLPSGIQWIGNSSVTAGSAITFSGNVVRWNVGSWNAAQEVITGSFDVRVTPTTSMLGRYPVLVSSATLRYRDNLGQEQVTISDSATTRTADPIHPSNGKVLP